MEDFELDGLFFDEPIDNNTIVDKGADNEDKGSNKPVSTNSDEAIITDEIVFGPAPTKEKEASEKTNDSNISFDDEEDQEEEVTEDTVQVNTAYFEFLKQNNLINVPDDFEFDGSPEKIAEAHEQTLNAYKASAFSAIMDALPENIQGLLQYALEGGSDYQSFLNQPTTFDVSTPEGQESAIRYFYKNSAGWDDKRIDKLISRLDDEELAEEATDAIDQIEELNKKERENALLTQKKQKEEAEERQKQFQQNIKNVINTVGYIEPARKNNIKNFMFNPVRRGDGVLTDYQRTLQNIQTNPEHLAQLADLLLDYDKEKGISYSRFEKKAKTTLTKDLKRHLDQTVADKVPSLSIKNKDNKNKEDIDWKAFLRRAQ